jgi:tetratricopeptide (TPR) repeat protein
MVHRSRLYWTGMTLALVGLAWALGCSGSSKVDNLYKEGMLFYKNHRYYNAIAKFEQALKIQPDNALVLTKCADAYLKTNKPDQAIQYGMAALKADPKMDEASLVVGQAHLVLAISGGSANEGGAIKPKAEELKAAKQIADDLLKRRPDSIEGKLLGARIDVLSGHKDLAEQAYRAVLGKQPANALAQEGLIDMLMARKAYSQAESLARQAMARVSKDAGPNTSLYNQLAASLMAQKRYDDAYATLLPLTSGDNKNPDLTNFLMAGQVLTAQLQDLNKNVGSEEEAQGENAPATAASVVAKNDATIKKVAAHLEALGASMKSVYPDSPDSWFFRGLSYELLGDMDSASQHFSEAVSRSRTGSTAQKRYRMALALADVNKDDFVQAQQELSTLLKLYPNDFDARLLMAKTKEASDAADDAIALYRALMLERPDDARVVNGLARLLMASKEPTDVAEGGMYMNQLADRPGTTPANRDYLKARALTSEGLSLRRQGKIKESDDKLLAAEEKLRQSIVENPKNALSETTLAQLAKLRNDIISALAHARRAAELDPRQASLQASLYESLGQLAAAADVYRKLLKKYPNSVKWSLNLAEVLIKQGQTSETLSILDAAIAKNPKDFRFYIDKSRALMTAGRPDQALAALADGQRQLPDQAALLMESAVVQMKINRPVEAAKTLANAYKMTEENLALKRAQGATKGTLTNISMNLSAISLDLATAGLLTGNWGDVAPKAQKSAQLIPGTSGQAELLQAIAMLGQARPKQAQEIVEKSAAAGALLPAQPFIQALALAAQGKQADALKAVDDAKSMDGGTRDLFRQLIRKATTKQAGQAAVAVALQVMLAGLDAYGLEVIDQCEAALKTLPDNPFVLSRKAETLRMLGRLDEATGVYDRLAKLVPDNAAVPSVQTEIYTTMAERSAAAGKSADVPGWLDKAEASARLALKQAPDKAAAIGKLAIVLQARAKREEANVLYRKVIQIDSGNWTAYNNLAWNLALAGNLDEADRVATEAVKHAPRSGAARGGVLDTAGWVAYRRGQLPDALRLLQEAVLYSPNHPEIRLHWAQALAKSGQKDKAGEELEAIIVATPGDPRIGEARQLLRQVKPNSMLLTGSAAGGKGA